MTAFAKLFDTAHGQLLAFLDETDEGDPCITIIGERCNDIRPKVQMSGWPEEDGAERAFEKVTQGAAEDHARVLRGTVAGLGRPA